MPLALIDEIAAKLEGSLERTMEFGYREAQAEIRARRSVQAAHRRDGGSTLAWQMRQEPRGRATTVLAYSVPDAGKFGEYARQGKDGLRRLIAMRAQRAAQAVGTAVAAAQLDQQTTKAAQVASLALVATRTLHNYVLELVGETLNLGRTAGALGMDPVPQFAMRSEQLDEATCDECDSLHGEIVQVDSPDYYDILPPEGCLGGGRCRGLMTFGD